MAIAACLMLSVLNSCSNDEPDFKDNTKGSIVGNVYDATTNLPIASAFVMVYPIEVYVYTDKAGEYQFYNLEPDGYYVASVAAGYETAVVDVNVRAGRESEVMIYMTPKSGSDNPDDPSNPSDPDNPSNPDTPSNPDNPSNPPKEDYSSAEVSWELPDLRVELISCKRVGSAVELVYTMTNTDKTHKQGVTLNNVNATTDHTHIGDNLGNWYLRKQVKMSLGGKDFGYGNDIEGTLLSDIPVKAVITVNYVDPKATKMNYYIYTSTAKPGGVVYSSDVVFKNVPIY